MKVRSIMAACILLAAFSLLMGGCRILGDYDNNETPTENGFSISGNIELPAGAQGNIRALLLGGGSVVTVRLIPYPSSVGIATVSVTLSPQLTGSYSFTGVPGGQSYRVVLVTTNRTSPLLSSFVATLTTNVSTLPLNVTTTAITTVITQNLASLSPQQISTMNLCQSNPQQMPTQLFTQIQGLSDSVVTYVASATPNPVWLDLQAAIPPISWQQIIPSFGTEIPTFYTLITAFRPGDTVTFHGTQFVQNGTTLNGLPGATATIAGPTQGSFVIPANTTAGTYQISVTTNAGTSASQNITILANNVSPWISQSLNGVTANFCGVAIDGTTGWIVGDDKLLRSIDSGNTWTQPTGLLPQNAFLMLYGVSSRNGTVAVVGMDSDTLSGFYLTNRSGSWVNGTDAGSSNLYAASTWDANTIMLGGQHVQNFQNPNAGTGQISRLTQNGLSNVVPNPGTLPTGVPFIVRSIATVDGNIFWAAGNKVSEPGQNSLWGLAKSTDAGQTWTHHVPIADNALALKNFNAITFVGTSRGWAVGNDGTIIFTTDGGSTWTAQAVPAGLENTVFYGVSFIDAQRGWVVGGNGTILRTSNGGMSWTKLNSGTANDLLGVTFKDALNGWVVGNQGTILKTTTGGI